MISSGLQVKSKFNNIKKKIHEKFKKKYEDMPLRYNSNIIDNIIYNERSHIVAKFKDRLITDDNGEFLKRYYNLEESFIRLPKFFEYYELYSKIFPNYTAIVESKYLYQNIQKKQKMIDLQEKMEIEKQKMKNKENEENVKKKLQITSDFVDEYDNNDRSKKTSENVFSTDIINSILSKSNSEEIELLFNINKKNISKEEKVFSEKIQKLVLSINKYDEKNKKEKEKDKNKSSSKKKESNSGKKNKINKSLLGNDFNNKYVKINNNINNNINKNIFRKKNTIFNVNNEKISNKSINNKKNNITKINKNEINLIKLIESNIFKKKKKNSKHHNKNIFHNVSSSTSLKKDFSKTKFSSKDNSKKLSCYSLNILNNINVSFPQRIINYNIINPNVKNNIKTSNPLSTRKIQKNVLNFSLDKKKLSKNNKAYLLKYTNSSNNIFEINKKKKSKSNEDKSKKRSQTKSKNTPKSFRKNNIINPNIQKITGDIKKLNGRRISYNNFSKMSKYKNNTYHLLDSRYLLLNNFLKTYRHRKSSSHNNRRSARSISNSAHNVTKSRSKSNKKNESKNNIFESTNTSNIFKKKNNTKNINNNVPNMRNIKPIKNNKKNIVNKFNVNIDSRNKKILFRNKNIFRSKTKNILFPNESYLKMCIFSAINKIKSGSKNKDMKKYSNLSNKNFFK